MYFILFGLSVGLAIGTKPIVLMFGPGLVLMAGLLIYYNPRHFLPKFIYAALWSIMSFVLLGSYNYVLNWLDYNSISGPDVLAQEHLIQTLPIRSIVTNLGQISFYFFDPGGLPNPLVEFIQQWRPQVGQEIFSLFVPEALYTGFDFTDTRQVTPREDAACYGPLGFLLFWPVLFFILVIAPFTRQGVSNFSHAGIWKWLVALISVSFLIIFAIFFRWNLWIDRTFIISVALGGTLSGLFIYLRQDKKSHPILENLIISFLAFFISFMGIEFYFKVFFVQMDSLYTLARQNWYFPFPIPDGNYRVIPHVDDYERYSAEDVAAYPKKGMIPTNGWPVGSTIREVTAIKLPSTLPTGTYSLYAGLYNPETLVRLPVYDSLGKHDEFLLTSVEATEPVDK